MGRSNFANQYVLMGMVLFFQVADSSLSAFAEKIAPAGDSANYFPVRLNSGQALLERLDIFVFEYSLCSSLSNLFGSDYFYFAVR